MEDEEGKGGNEKSWWEEQVAEYGSASSDP